MLSLGSTHTKPLTDAFGDERMIHSLNSYDHLKIDPENILVFANQKYEKREI